jgi:hypothetical protein
MVTGGPLAQQADRLGDMRFQIQHRRWPHSRSPHAWSVRRSRTSPRASTAICRAEAGAAASAALPCAKLAADGVDDLG